LNFNLIKLKSVEYPHPTYL